MNNTDGYALSVYFLCKSRHHWILNNTLALSTLNAAATVIAEYLVRGSHPKESFAKCTALDLLRLVYQWELKESFTNFIITFCTVFLNQSLFQLQFVRDICEKKLIKAYERSTVRRRSNLSKVLSVDRNINSDFSYVIEDFANI